MPRTKFVQAVLQGQGAGPEGLALEGADGQVHTLTPRQVAAFIVVSAADIGEQWHSWQDEIFAGYPQQQRRDLKTHWAASLWPGPLKPPSNILSMLSHLLAPLSRLSRLADGTGIPVPPAFDHCRATLTPRDEAAASALYWQVVTRMQPLTEMDSARHMLEAAVEHNPWVGEPRLMLAQLALTAGDFEAAERHAAAGLAALQAWGTAWDKRIEWAGWMAWARIELQNARAPLAGEPGRAQRAGTGGMTLHARPMRAGHVDIEHFQHAGHGVVHHFLDAGRPVIERRQGRGTMPPISVTAVMLRRCARLNGVSRTIITRRRRSLSVTSAARVMRLSDRPWATAASVRIEQGHDHHAGGLERAAGQRGAHVADAVYMVCQRIDVVAAHVQLMLDVEHAGRRDHQVRLDILHAAQLCSMRTAYRAPVAPVMPTTRRRTGSGRGAGLLQQGLELAGLVHLGHDVRAADEFAGHVQLRDGRPVRVFLDALADFVVLQHVDRHQLLDATALEDLDGLARSRTGETGRCPS